MHSLSTRPDSAVIRRGVRAAAVGASLTTAVVLGVADYIVRRITRPARGPSAQLHTYTPWEIGLPWQDVSIPTDGESLDAWFIPAEDARAPVIIPLAGHGGSKGDLLGIARYLWQTGFSQLLFDYRGAGRSPGNNSTLGYRETLDTLYAIDWVAQQVPGAPIGLIGYSMGGAIAILAAAQDKRVGAVVSDCAFASQRDAISHVVQRTLRLPSGPFLAAADRMMERRQGFRFESVEPRAQVHRIAPRPLFIIHGDQDEIVPVSHAYELYEAAGEPKRLWIVEDAPHVGGYFADRPRYCHEVASFFSDALTRRAHDAPQDAVAG